MSATPPFGSSAGSRALVDRVKGILLRPQQEWVVIEAEPATVKSIYQYVMIIAAIPAVCTALRWSMVGDVRLGGVWAIRFAITSYIGSLISVYLLALIIDALAPKFGGQKGQIAALKVTAYSSTAAWLAGVFNLLPLLGILALAGVFYSLYLLFLGLPVLMKAPADKAMTYTVVAIVAAVIVFAVIGALVGQLSGFGAVLSGYGR